MAKEYPQIFSRPVSLYADPLQIEVVGNSGCAASPSEIFAGKDFGQTLESLKEYYDYILFEGPSLNNCSDTRELETYVDKVIPVFSGRISTQFFRQKFD